MFPSIQKKGPKMELGERVSLHRALHTEQSKLGCFSSMVPSLWDCIVGCPEQATLWTGRKAERKQSAYQSKQESLDNGQ